MDTKLDRVVSQEDPFSAKEHFSIKRKVSKMEVVI